MLGMEILVIIGLILLLLVLWIISVQRKFAVMDGNIECDVSNRSADFLTF